MSSQVKNHTHQWVRYTIPPGGNIFNAIFRCNLPDCFKKAPRADLINKNSLCYKCKAEFVLDYQELNKSRPVCPNCSNRKEFVSKRRAQSLLDKFLTDGKSVVDLGAE